MLDDQSFSKELKLAKNDYLYHGRSDISQIDQLLDAVSKYPLDDLVTDPAIISFWIKIYNGLTNYSIIKLGITKTTKEDSEFFTRKLLTIEGLEFSLDDIEHGILRCNRPRKKGNNQLVSPDLKLSLVPNHFDANIHFALNCGASSCPPTAFYNSISLDHQLLLARENYAGLNFSVDHDKKRVIANELFSWYKEDFKGDFLTDPHLLEYEVVLKAYDWSLF